MNDQTKIIYNLARMHEYVRDAMTICEQHDYDYEEIIENMVTRYAINMCIVQMGEHAARIRDIDRGLYRDSRLSLFQIKGMRDHITHSYGNIDYKVVKNVLKNDLPEIKAGIEKMVHPDVIKNPYMLYEQEYEDYLDEVVSLDPMKECMRETAARTPQINITKERER